METLIFSILKKLITNKWFWIITAFLGVLSYASISRKQYISERKQRLTWQENYAQEANKVDSSLDLLGRVQSQVKTLTFSSTQLNNALSEKNSQLYQYKKELEASRIKVKNLKHMLVTSLNSNNTGNTIIHDTIIVNNRAKKIKVQDGYLYFQAWWQDKDSVNWKYKYTEKIYIWTTNEPTIYNRKHKKRFFIVRWLFPKYHVVTRIKSNNTNSKIEALQINVIDK